MSDTVTKVDAPDGADDLFKEYALALTKVEDAKAELAPLRKKLLALFPKDRVGDFEMQAGNWVTTVSYPERKKWNSDEIAAFFGADLPIFVKRVLSISDEDFGRLPTDQRAALNGAVSYGIGTPKISVEVVR